MQNCQRYSIQTRKRYDLVNLSFWAGVVYFFGGRENPYSRVIKRIRELDVEDALRNDLCQIHEDFRASSHTFAKYLEDTKKHKELVDAK